MAQSMDLLLPKHLFRAPVFEACGAGPSRFSKRQPATFPPPQHSTRAETKPKPDDARQAKDSEGSIAEQAFRPFYPTSSELIRVLALWDTDRDGKIWISDFDMIIHLAYGIRTGEASGNSHSTHEKAADSIAEATQSSEVPWRKLRKDCTTWDGLVNIHKVTCMLAGDGFVREVSRLVTECHVRLLTSGRSLSPPGTKGMSNYVRAFMKLDSDKNGLICARDLKDRMAAITGMNLSNEMCREIVRKVDRNNDGVVDLAEFPELVKLLE